MNSLYSFAAKSVLVLAAAVALFSCQKNPQIIYADDPFTAVYVTAEGEKVKAEVNGYDMSLRFSDVEDFTSCDITIDLNDGYACVYPSSLKGVDLTVEDNLVLHFSCPDKSTRKFYFKSIVSNALPIADPSKISVKGNPSFEVNNTSKRITIYFDAAKMDMSDVEITFGAGALISGAQVTSPTTFDFTSTNIHDLVIKAGNVETVYVVKLDKSSLMPNPKTYNFDDVTANYTDAEGITILKLTGNGLAGIVPERQRFYGGSQFVSETPYGPYDGWIYFGYDPDATVWVAQGDWTSDRDVDNDIIIEDVVIVLLDEEYFAGKVVANESNSVAVSSIGSWLAITGTTPTQGDAGIYSGGNFYDPYLDATYANIQNDGFARTGIAFDKDGKFYTGTLKYAGGKWMRSNVLYSAEGIGEDAFVEEIPANDVLISCPAPVRGNHALTKVELGASDCGWEPSFGDAWNGYRSRVFAGVTFDGRVGYACFKGGAMDEYPWYYGIGTFQASWLLNKLGFSDVIQLGTSMYTDDAFAPTIVLDGKTLIGNAGQVGKYCIAYDPK